MAKERAQPDAKVLAEEIERRLENTVRVARDAIGKVEDPRAWALFETTAEVLIGLGKAFRDYRTSDEQAWQ